MQKFARDAYELGIRYIGGCCGFEPYHIRAIAEEVRFTVAYLALFMLIHSEITQYSRITLFVQHYFDEIPRLFPWLSIWFTEIPNCSRFSQIQTKII